MEIFYLYEFLSIMSTLGIYLIVLSLNLFTFCLGLKLKIVECIERKSQTVVDNSKCIDEDEPADVPCKKDPCVPGMYVLEKYEIMYSLITIMFHLKTYFPRDSSN